MKEWNKIRLINKELEKRIDDLPNKLGLNLLIKYTFGKMSWINYVESVNKYYEKRI